MNIKTKGMLFSFILILLATVTLGGSSYIRFKSILVNEANKAVVMVAEESADHLNNYIKQFIAPLIALSEDEIIKSMEWEKQKEVIGAQINPQYLDILLVDLKGIAHDIDDSVINLSDREYIKEALTGKVSISDIIISRITGKPVIVVGVPIYKYNLIKGLLIATLDADFLSEYTLTRGYGENGRAYIISDKGNFISRPEKEKSEDLYNLYAIAGIDKKYTSFTEFVRSTRNDQTGYGNYVYDNHKILVGYASVEETHWKIYVGTYEDEILESLDGLNKMSRIIVVSTLVVCLIAAWFFVDKFTKPIVELADLFSQGARGNLTIRFTPKTKDEIGRVGLSFNRMMDKIKTLTQYDPLTSLLNQYVLEKDIESFIHNENVMDFSLIMVAIDKFGQINETYGYTFGDAILVEIAKRISICDTENYQIYRYKGEKFVVLYHENQNKDQINIKAQKILEILTENYQINGRTVNININMGVFTWDDETRLEEPLKAVTHAKNYAKYLGSNQIQTFDLQLYTKIRISKDLQADIISGLKENQFFMVYQPLFYLNNENIAEAEALIRWNHPEKGLLYPDQFIDYAESSGLIINIDQWVLETACKQLKIWKDNKKTPLMLSINISAKTFETKKFIPKLLTLINTYDVDPSLLQLEITERMLIHNVDEGINKLNELRSMGIRIAIDDFGIGYSSLSYIVRLPIDSIKIDKSFVHNINSSKEAKAIISTIINLCKTLNLNVIAEGIESKFELEYLKSSQCDIGQGYYYSKPVSIDDIEKHI
ncbi:MAG: EAL domain-containing protein [Herbinix sp.]|nr:EAL domain-containing protein [Herbinix sp.]